MVTVSPATMTVAATTIATATMVMVMMMAAVAMPTALVVAVMTVVVIAVVLFTLFSFFFVVTVVMILLFLLLFLLILTAFTYFLRCLLWFVICSSGSGSGCSDSCHCSGTRVEVLQVIYLFRAVHPIFLYCFVCKVNVASKRKKKKSLSFLLFCFRRIFPLICTFLGYEKKKLLFFSKLRRKNAFFTQ